MAHMMKHTMASCGHMFAHYDRKAGHISNENVDRTRTHLNYNLAAHQQMGQGEFVKQRCSEVYRQGRKNLNVMVSWIVTAPKDLPEKEHGQFFRATYDFLEKRYGRQNVISAYVHMDEVQPHIHFAFVPVVNGFRRKNGCVAEVEKVSAKELVNRADLQSFHPDLSEHLKSVLGHEVSILNEATKDGNRSIDELKRQSAADRLRETEMEASRIVSKATLKAQGINDSLIAVKAEYEVKKAYVREADRLSDVSIMYPEGAKVTEKGVFNKQRLVTVPAEMWEARHISASEKDYLRKASAQLEKGLQDFRNTTTAKNLGALAQRVEALERENAALRIGNRNVNQKIGSVGRKADKILERVGKVLDRLPDGVTDAFVKEWESLDKEKSMDIEMDIER